MADRILTADLKPGMLVTSQRTATCVYSFGTSLHDAKAFDMKGKAIVLFPLTRVRLKTRRYDGCEPSTGKHLYKDSFRTKNMLLLCHFKHGIVMYFVHDPSRDDKWRLVKEKEPSK